MTAHPIRIAALIVAAGSSRRMGGELPKQYRELGGVSVVRRSVLALLNHPQVDEVCVVIAPEHAPLYTKAVDGLKLLPSIHGGNTRQQSVRNGLDYLVEHSDATHVLVHDAARCFIDEATISRLCDSLRHGAQAVVPSLPVSDTLKKVKGDKVEATVDRLNLHLTQTPQAFDIKLLYSLHLNTQSTEATDDAALAETQGIPVDCVAGSTHNFKLTTPEDWQRAQMLIEQAYTYRTGMGFDVHRLVPRSAGRQLQLCGVTVEHDHVLNGHSDADVGLHAVTDAILGALALGDIGTHFPPSDPQWKGADSARFIAYCVQQLQARQAQLTHVDVTLICEAPKVAPHRAAMQQRMCELLEIPAESVSIKATTSEGLGFTGRREGIAAQAIATVKLPQASIA